MGDFKGVVGILSSAGLKLSRDLGEILNFSTARIEAQRQQERRSSQLDSEVKLNESSAGEAVDDGFGKMADLVQTLRQEA